MTKIRNLLAIAAFALAPVAGHAAQLISNGNFEGVTTLGSGYQMVDSSTAGNYIPGWSVQDTGTVDVIRNAFGAIGLNSNSIDLLGTGAHSQGGLYQSFVLPAAANSLTLSFDYFKNGNTPGLFRVEIFHNDGQGPYASWTLDAADVSSVTSFSDTFFTSDKSGSYTLLFSALGTGTSGPVIDNVSVTAVPEPHEWALLLSGLGVTGWVARRRRAKSA